MIGIIYRGTLRKTLVLCDIDISLGVCGITDCIECGGTGDWTPFHPEPHLGPFQCIECKGAGKIMVSI
jgi:hypothetical protein